MSASSSIILSPPSQFRILNLVNDNSSAHREPPPLQSSNISPLPTSQSVHSNPVTCIISSSPLVLPIDSSCNTLSHVLPEQLGTLLKASHSPLVVVDSNRYGNGSPLQRECSRTTTFLADQQHPPLNGSSLTCLGMSASSGALQSIYFPCIYCFEAPCICDYISFKSSRPRAPSFTSQHPALSLSACSSSALLFPSTCPLWVRLFRPSFLVILALLSLPIPPLGPSGHLLVVLSFQLGLYLGAPFLPPHHVSGCVVPPTCSSCPHSSSNWESKLVINLSHANLGPLAFNFLKQDWALSWLLMPSLWWTSSLILRMQSALFLPMLPRRLGKIVSWPFDGPNHLNATSLKWRYWPLRDL
ncbi:hypothetical protein SUGI_0066380 [Cryptomeria japonica]|nr:hypothetical protein SUGI_0066380 [Cryptomeria japonica]